MQFRRMKRYLSTFLAVAVILNTGAFDVMAAGSNAGEKTGETSNQATSALETVYVDSYGAAGERSVSFNDHWRFYLGDVNGAEARNYNDASWKNVNLPHDYSIDQGYTAASPVEPESGLVLGGTGWYRKAFTLPSEAADKVVSVDFDGVYMNATVYLNGEKLGTHPYGYTPFSFVLPADVLKTGGEENVLAVKVENKLPSSRWYSGSGIYRDVKLTVTDSVHVSYFGTTVTTPDIEEGTGTVNVVTSVKNDSAETKSVSVRQTVYEKGSTEAVVTGEKTTAEEIAAGEEGEITAEVTVPSPKLWAIGKPNLYRVHTEVYVGDDVVDAYDSEFGFRWIEFTRENGFFLNGENMKMNGVCMHHDQGGLGSEAWYRATERQVEKLMEMGVNTIRVTHNPASQILIDICNEKGMLLIEESFDCWYSGKNGNVEDYGKWFDEKIEAGNQIVGAKADEKWCEFDLKAMIKRGKNAPSIVMWSLGNEIFEGLYDTSRVNEYPAMAQQLITWVGEEDATRYVTYGDNQIKNGGYISTAEKFATASTYSNVPGGVVGFNYANSAQVKSGYDRNWMVYGSETASSVNSRGVYDRKNSNSDGGKGDRRLTSYDKSKVGWGALASEGMWVTMRQDFNAGEFIWTGFDYIGEPTPYNGVGTVGSNNSWPNMAKSSYFGIIDLAGFPKDSFYLYQSQWNDKVNTLHVLPVWNRDEIMIDDDGNVEVVVYSDAPVIKLYLNGKEVGTATAAHTDTPTGGYQNYTEGTGCFDTGKASGHTSLYATFNVPYEEGKLEAKAFDAEGNEIEDTEGRSFVETTKEAAELTAEADRTEITADGKDLSYITIDVQDEDGKFVNGAEPEITVSVEGNGVLMALDNGVQNDTTAHSEKTRKAGKGKLLAIVQSTKKAGSFTVKAQAQGLTETSVTVTTRAESLDPSEKKMESYEISRHLYVKKGVTPQLPATVKVNYTDGTSETKNITWESVTSEETEYEIYGTIADVNVRVPIYITVIEAVAALLNYSAAVGLGSDFTLPASRPAVLPDGTILSAEFPVTWNGDVDMNKAETQKIQGTSNVFGETINVLASIRVTSGDYKDGSEAMANVPEMYINGISSKERESVAETMAKLKDDKMSKNDAAWSGRGTLDFRLDTAINLKNIKLYLKDTTPTSNTMKIYSSGDNGANWKLEECTVSNQRSDGVTVRTFAPKQTVSETYLRVEFTKNTTLTELELNTRIPTFPIGEDAKLSSLKAGGYTANAATLNKGWFGVEEASLSENDIQASGKDNASLTILPKDAEGIVRILLESEDNNVRSSYQVHFGKSNTEIDPDNAMEDALDYPYNLMTLTAASYQATSGSEGGPELANDGDEGTIWHSRWGGGVGNTDLTNLPKERYLQIELDRAQEITALRYLPRSNGENGSVKKAQVKVSETELTEDQWYAKENVCEVDWTKAFEWKLAKFSGAVTAKYIRLYGAETYTNNKFMSAAEVRVRVSEKNVLHNGNTQVTLTDNSLNYNGSALKPEPTVVYKGESGDVTLTKGTDYKLSYRNNVEPGTATVVVEGIANYTGIVEAEFTINSVEQSVDSYDAVSVTTEKGVYPELPGTVIANTNVGQKLMEVQWDRIADSRLKKFGTFNIYGTVIETDTRVTAEVTVCDVVGIQQVTLVTVVGVAPQMPDKVTVHYSNGETAQRDVEWDLSEVSFDAAGIVKVTGISGKSQTEASVRVEEQTDTNTPAGKNLALNADGVNKPKEWPRTFAYISSPDDPAHRATDGVKEFVSNASKQIWCDWESGVFHTDADNYPYVVSAFGAENSESNADQKKYSVNKVRIGFMEEDGNSASKVRLPQEYKIEYYSGANGVIPADKIEKDSAGDCSKVRDWSDADNPMKNSANWTEVTYVGEKPSVPALSDFKHLVDVKFETVETTAIRIVLQPQGNNWTGLEEFEVYYEPISENDSFTVTAINVDGVNKLADFDADTKTLEVDAAEGVITAAADNNASVTVLEMVQGETKVIFLPENGDEAKKQEYTVVFKKAEISAGKHLVTAEDEMVEIAQGEAAQGETVTFQIKKGYEFKTEPTLIKSADRTPSNITIDKAADGSYRFEMPDYPVTIKGESVVIEYQITYNLDGGQAANRQKYTVETPYFRLNKPVKEGSIFIGWTGNGFTEPVINMLVDAGTTGDLEFTAHWRVGTEYNITFDTDGGGEVAPQKVPVASGKITEPETPKKHGYDFVGWFIDEEKTKQWNFATDLAETDMTLYAKWVEGEITVNTGLVHYLGEAFELPAKLSITIAGETFDTDVIWNAEEKQAVEEATEIGLYTVTGTLSDPEGRTLALQVPVSPAGIVYYLDNGATKFTDKGLAVVEANKDIIQNKNKTGRVVTDGAYSAETGWGYTNPEEEVGSRDGEDVYESIRNMSGSAGRGKTLSYQFDNLPAGEYTVAAGFFDPWAQYAGDFRHAKVILADAEGKELAVEEDHHISGEKQTVSFEKIVMEKKGSVTLNIEPKSTDNADCDVMVSFIVIQRTKAAEEVPITEIVVKETAKTIKTGETYQIQASVVPEETTDDDTLEYVSTKEEVATVDKNGLVTAIAEGETEIVISCEREGVTATVKITVTDHDILITGIKVEEKEASIEVGDQYQIRASVQPEETTENKTLKYVSSNEKVATVDESGLVTAIAEGEADIVISCEREGITATVKITVTEKGEKPVTQIKVKETSKTVLIGTPYQIEATLENPQEGDTLKYASSNEEAATVDENGLVMPIAVGETDIEISCERQDVSPVIVKISVTDHAIAITEIKVRETKATIKEGESYEIDAWVEPEDTTESKTLTYVSDNTDVATVDGNKVTAVAEGTAEIEITCVNKDVPAAKVEITVISKDAQDIATPEQRTELTNCVNDLKAKYADLSKYTAASVAIFNDALAKAENVLGNPNATAAEVQEALDALKAAEAGLALNPPTVATPEQRLQLTNQIAALKAKYTDLSKYTAASVTAYNNALAAAEFVLNNPNATAIEVQQALDALALAEAGLTLNPPTQTSEPNPPKKGYKFKVGSLQYQVTKSSAKNGTVSVVKLMKKTSKKITIPATVKVKVKGKSFTFKVTQINSKVFQNNKKLKEVVIGANITKIGTKSFYGCKNLGKITFKGT
ncbi:DUF4982 domain-containing protein, partial [Lachnospiraceae bacterium]|nr:DUF4982 domain-containing protein [Lachnospiraceae bacterium]